MKTKSKNMTNMIDLRNDMMSVWSQLKGPKPDLPRIAQQNNTIGKVLQMVSLDLKASLAMGLKPDLAFLGIDESTRQKNPLGPVNPMSSVADDPEPAVKRGPGRPRKVS